MNIPKVLPNGAEVLKVSWSVLTNQGVVLARLKKNPFYEYVTWIFSNPDFSDTSCGHYFNTKFDKGPSQLAILFAQDDFRERS